MTLKKIQAPPTPLYRAIPIMVALVVLVLLFGGCTSHLPIQTDSPSGLTPTPIATSAPLPTATPTATPSPTPPPPSEEYPVIALTFDDGPSSRDTGTLLDLLAAENVKATFFVLGNQIDAGRSELVKRAFDEGHEIANHTYSHLTLTDLNPEQITEELDRSNQLIQEITGVLPTLMRPPLGAFNEDVQSVCQNLNLAIVSWSWQSCPEDWNLRGQPEVIAEYVITHAANGHIILLHDTNASTVEAMPAMIQGLKDRGFRFMTVSEMLSWQDDGAPLPGEVYHYLSQ